MDLRYGKGSVSFETPPGLLGIIEPRAVTVRPVDDLLKESMMNPVGGQRLRETLRRNKPGHVVIVVSDITRKIAHYDQTLKFLAAELVGAGIDEKNIEFVIALGTHRRHTREEDELLYGTLPNEFGFIPHDCRSDLVSLGKTSTGLDVSVNRRIKEADFIITTGRVDFHYLAGFSGGRKSILPGVASYETIRNNHKKLARRGVDIGKIDGNIIAQEMAEAADLSGIDYLLNVIETPEWDIARVFSGDPCGAFQEAVGYFVGARQVGISAQADCVIVSAGGFPQDKNFYHTHKSINLAMQALKRKGSIILIGQCAEGFGNEKFMELMLEHKLESLLHYPEEKIDVGGHRAFSTAKILKAHHVYALTDLDPDVVRKINFTPVQSIDEGIDAVRREYGEDLKTLVIPNGKAVLPSLNGRKNALN
jgi:nickel-dependent lactate racemase